MPAFAGMTLLVLSAAGCGQKTGESASTPAAAPAAKLAPPADAKLAKIFDTTCRTCHAVPSSGAPQAGDAAAWKPRLAQGKETLLSHTMNGYQRMPPMGLCMQCGDEEFTALIEYMSGSKL